MCSPWTKNDRLLMMVTDAPESLCMLQRSEVGAVLDQWRVVRVGVERVVRWRHAGERTVCA